MFRIESLLSARTFASPQVIGERVYFLSNLSGHLSLYAMDAAGSVPEPLLPPQIALQNPHLIGGASFAVFPRLGKILVMLDRDGDENYQPMFIPLDGGFPEPVNEAVFSGGRSHLALTDAERNTVYFVTESHNEPVADVLQVNLETGEVVKLASTPYEMFPLAHTADHRQVILGEMYTAGDVVLYRWDTRSGQAAGLYGTPLAQRIEAEPAPLSGIIDAQYDPTETGLLVLSAVFEDTYSLAYLDLDGDGSLRPVPVTGQAHTGAGEMVSLRHLYADVYTLEYNIDGVSWLYRGRFQRAAMQFALEQVLVGQAGLAGGVLQSQAYERESGRLAISFSTAITPTQLYLLENNGAAQRLTREKVLGIATDLLSAGEDASYTTFDGMRVSARLYMPSPQLGFAGPRPVVFYIHGGPQGQERPDFGWFSMPLIQFLTLNGLAVFVPNARGSTGYGLAYTKQVDRDWGGQDRLDHIHALELLRGDPHLDVRRAGVVGRSYGGYMTLTLAGRHPQAWSAAVDMFGPYDLLTFSQRIPETWKPYFRIALGDPVEDRDFLVERSPRTYLDQLACPMLVIQGRNDPRVVERESHDLVENLQRQGKQITYLMFENEGHDVLKYENRVTCYNRITEFFVQHLMP